ncbi:hypothetical protein NUACC21_45100 [Scytonema sp. NUACC21]
MTNKTLSINEHTSRIARISTLLDSLRQKVKKFSVLDKQSQLVGEVEDLMIDGNRQINFVVSTENWEEKQFFLLSSKLIEKIDSQAKCIFLNIEKSQIKYLFETNLEKENQTSKMENNSKSFQENTQDLPTKRNDGERDSVDEIVRLLGERVVIDRSKRKVGEVIVRKQVETRMVQVPIRSEKLIVEQVSPERKQLAEIDLRQGEIAPEFEFNEAENPYQVDGFDGSLTVSGEFNSPKIASLLLNAIALEKNHGCKAVRVTIVVEDEERQQTYQEWFARTSKTGK